MTIARMIEGRDIAVVTCDVSCSVREAVAVLSQKRIGALPVIDNGEVAGIFSERDALRELHKHGPAMLDLCIADVMTSPPVTVEPSTSVLAALSLMTRRRIRHLPVMDGDRMVGFISIGDLVKYRIEKIESEAEALRSYIQSA